MLKLAGIVKQFPGCRANDAVDLTVMPGEIHAVLGENGAGKSTLMKIIYGSVKPDEGSVMFNGQPVHIRNPQEARALGISMVFQHFSLFDTLTVAENVWLGLDKSLTLPEVSASITAKATEYGLDIDPGRPVRRDIAINRRVDRPPLGCLGRADAGAEISGRFVSMIEPGGVPLAHNGRGDARIRPRRCYQPVVVVYLIGRPPGFLEQPDVVGVRRGPRDRVLVGNPVASAQVGPPPVVT